MRLGVGCNRSRRRFLLSRLGIVRGSTVATNERSAEEGDGREGSRVGGRASRRESWKGMRGMATAGLVRARRRTTGLSGAERAVRAELDVEFEDAAGDAETPATVCVAAHDAHLSTTTVKHALVDLVRLRPSPQRDRPPFPPPTICAFPQCLSLRRARVVCLEYPPLERALFQPQAGPVLHLPPSNNHTHKTTNTSPEHSRTRSRQTTLPNTALVARATPPTRLSPCPPCLTPRSAAASP